MSCVKRDAPKYKPRHLTPSSPYSKNISLFRSTTGHDYFDDASLTDLYLQRYGISRSLPSSSSPNAQCKLQEKYASPCKTHISLGYLGQRGGHQLISEPSQTDSANPPRFIRQAWTPLSTYDCINDRIGSNILSAKFEGEFERCNLRKSTPNTHGKVFQDDHSNVNCVHGFNQHYENYLKPPLADINSRSCLNQDQRSGMFDSYNTRRTATRHPRIIDRELAEHSPRHHNTCLGLPNADLRSPNHMRRYSSTSNLGKYKATSLFQSGAVNRIMMHPTPSQRCTGMPSDCYRNPTVYDTLCERLELPSRSKSCDNRPTPEYVANLDVSCPTFRRYRPGIGRPNRQTNIDLPTCSVTARRRPMSASTGLTGEIFNKVNACKSMLNMCRTVQQKSRSQIDCLAGSAENKIKESLSFLEPRSNYPSLLNCEHKSSMARRNLNPIGQKTRNYVLNNIVQTNKKTLMKKSRNTQNDCINYLPPKNTSSTITTERHLKQNIATNSKVPACKLMCGTDSVSFDSQKLGKFCKNRPALSARATSCGVSSTVPHPVRGSWSEIVHVTTANGNSGNPKQPSNETSNACCNTKPRRNASSKTPLRQEATSKSSPRKDFRCLKTTTRTENNRKALPSRTQRGDCGDKTPRAGPLKPVLKDKTCARLLGKDRRDLTEKKTLKKDKDVKYQKIRGVSQEKKCIGSRSNERKKLPEDNSKTPRFKVTIKDRPAMDCDCKRIAAGRARPDVKIETESGTDFSSKCSRFQNKSRGKVEKRNGKGDAAKDEKAIIKRIDSAKQFKNVKTDAKNTTEADKVNQIQGQAKVTKVGQSPPSVSADASNMVPVAHQGKTETDKCTLSATSPFYISEGARCMDKKHVQHLECWKRSCMPYTARHSTFYTRPGSCPSWFRGDRYYGPFSTACRTRQCLGGETSPTPQPETDVDGRIALTPQARKYEAAAPTSSGTGMFRAAKADVQQEPFRPTAANSERSAAAYHTTEGYGETSHSALTVGRSGADRTKEDEIDIANDGDWPADAPDVDSVAKVATLASVNDDKSSLENPAKIDFEELESTNGPVFKGGSSPAFSGKKDRSQEGSNVDGFKYKRKHYESTGAPNVSITGKTPAGTDLDELYNSRFNVVTTRSTATNASLTSDNFFSRRVSNVAIRAQNAAQTGKTPLGSNVDGLYSRRLSYGTDVDLNAKFLDYVLAEGSDVDGFRYGKALVAKSSNISEASSVRRDENVPNQEENEAETSPAAAASDVVTSSENIRESIEKTENFFVEDCLMTANPGESVDPRKSMLADSQSRGSKNELGGVTKEPHIPSTTSSPSPTPTRTPTPAPGHRRDHRTSQFLSGRRKAPSKSRHHSQSMQRLRKSFRSDSEFDNRHSIDAQRTSGEIFQGQSDVYTPIKSLLEKLAVRYSPAQSEKDSARASFIGSDSSHGDGKGLRKVSSRAIKLTAIKTEQQRVRNVDNTGLNSSTGKKRLFNRTRQLAQRSSVVRDSTRVPSGKSLTEIDKMISKQVDFKTPDASSVVDDAKTANQKQKDLAVEQVLSTRRFEQAVEKKLDEALPADSEKRISAVKPDKPIFTATTTSIAREHTRTSEANIISNETGKSLQAALDFKEEEKTVGKMGKTQKTTTSKETDHEGNFSSRKSAPTIYVCPPSVRINLEAVLKKGGPSSIHRIVQGETKRKREEAITYAQRVYDGSLVDAVYGQLRRQAMRAALKQDKLASRLSSILI
ncbi:hypothetical protein ElyMa_005358100 [Elysia marginata]|uniref:Uncharacterized protein n=1 Tax=Elysia marginata TaxID=1093978 RepID=A0AAV4ECB4_9GAST|nr:hypothetical protein ElyMa_005358100 [Elysia marginata]